MLGRLRRLFARPVPVEKRCSCGCVALGFTGIAYYWPWVHTVSECWDRSLPQRLERGVDSIWRRPK